MVVIAFTPETLPARVAEQPSGPPAESFPPAGG